MQTKNSNFSENDAFTRYLPFILDIYDFNTFEIIKETNKYIIKYFTLKLQFEDKYLWSKNATQKVSILETVGDLGCFICLEGQAWYKSAFVS